MKRILPALALLCVFAVACLSGCGGTNGLHKPNDVGGAVIATDFTYSAAGYTVGKYLGLPLCATPPVYPCKLQAINDRLVLANRAAYQAVMAAQAGGGSAQNATDKKAALSKELDDPEVKKQLELLAAKEKAGAP